MAVPELVAALDAVELGAEAAVGPAVLPELGAAVLEGVVPAEALKAEVLGAEVAVLVAAVGLGPAVLPELVAAVQEGVVLGEALALKKRFMRMENQATVNSHKPVDILWDQQYFLNWLMQG